MDEEIDLNASINHLLNTDSVDPRIFQNSCVGPRPVFREISNLESSHAIEENAHEKITLWASDLTELPSITQESIHKYMVVGNSFDDTPKGAIKHKIMGYQLFKENYVKKVRVKPRVMVERLSFLVKCSVVASMKKTNYTVYVHLCQISGDIFYAKCNCKLGAGGCCKHVAAVLYQLVDYRQLNVQSVPEDKTCTDLLQQWHVPGEGGNVEPIKFLALTFEKADLNKDLNKSRIASVPSCYW